MLPFISAGKVDIFVRRLLRLLDKAVQQNHAALHVDVKQHPCDAPIRQICADLK